MNTSEIKAVLSVRPDAVFLTADGAYVRIVEVKEFPQYSRGRQRTIVGFYVDILRQRRGSFSFPNAWRTQFCEELPSYEVERNWRTLKAREITSVMQGNVTLEEIGEEWLATALVSHEERKQMETAFRAMVSELSDATGIDSNILRMTDEEVLVALRNALKSSVSA